MPALKWLEKDGLFSKYSGTRLVEKQVAKDPRTPCIPKGKTIAALAKYRKVIKTSRIREISMERDHHFFLPFSFYTQ